MGKKVALLVGVGRCQGNNEKFPALQCPENGVAELEAILRNPKIGGFDQVESLIDPDLGAFQRRMGEFFTYPNVGKDDLVLLYFTGHGIKDMGGDFYLTTADTTFIGNRVNAGTAVPGSFVQGIFRNCYAQRKVIILDCCFGAAFAEGFLTMDDGGVDVEADLGGEGWVVLTAATARNYALEQEGEPLSVYTRYLVEGLKTGAAADLGERDITVRQLHDYVRHKVQVAAPTMEPSIFNGYQGEGIILARAVINPEREFRKAVAECIDSEIADITPVGKRHLKVLAPKLRISPQQEQSIISEELQPHRTRRMHLQEYEAAYREAIEYYRGLPEHSHTQLKKFQRLLGLRDEDVEKVHTHFSIPVTKPKPLQLSLIQALASIRSTSVSRTLTFVRPKAFTQKPTQSQASYQPVRQISRRRALTLTLGGSGGLILFTLVRPLRKILTSSPKTMPDISNAGIGLKILSQPPIFDNLMTKEYEVVTVNNTGNISNHQKKSARYFIEDLGDGVELVMMEIPGGQFLMGQTEAEKQALIQQNGEDTYQNHLADELPQHEVNLSEFWIGQFQITQAQYQAMMGKNLSNFNSANRPVEQVSWNDATKFCATLSEHTGRTYRLPSEAEWEYACRAGTTTPFHFGTTITTDLANYNGDYTYGSNPKGEYRQQTTEVGSFLPNAFGLYDMHGNVWEWCQDVWHSNYESAPTDGSAWMVDGEKDRRILRGGSWSYGPVDCRSASRSYGSRDGLFNYAGFRVVWVPA